eukprot:gene607-8111_t
MVKQSKKKPTFAPLGDQYSFSGKPTDKYGFVLKNKKAHGSVLHINNPGNFNRINLKGARALKKEIEKLNNVPLTRLIILRGSGTKSFSHGIDIFEIFNAVQKGDEFLPIELFREMYKLSFYISQISTPVMSIINGQMFSGGAALGSFNDYSVVTDGSEFSVPENYFGFYPDNGNLFLLSKVNKKYPGVGTFLALTGSKIDSTDMINCGIATHSGNLESGYFSLESIENTQIEYNERTTYEAILQALDPSATVDTQLSFSRDLKNIEKAFHQKQKVEDIMKVLKDLNTTWSLNTLKTLEAASPLSLKITLKAINEAKKLSLQDVYKMDYRISLRLIYTEDFKIGMEAFNNEGNEFTKPNWKLQLEDVKDDYVNSFFKPLVRFFF